MQVFELPQPAARTETVAFSPDGRLLAAASNGRLAVIDTAAGAVRALRHQPKPGLMDGTTAAFAADGRHVVVRHKVESPGAVEVCDAETGAAARAFALTHNDDGFVPLPGGREVVVAVHPTPGWADVEFVRWNPLTGERSAPFARHVNVVRWLATSTDGRWLAGTGGTEVRVWRLDGPKPPARASRVIRLDSRYATSLALSPDGGLLAAGVWEGVSGAIRLFDTRTGTSERLADRPRDLAHDLAFHPARPLLAMRGEPGEVVFYDTAARAEVRRYGWDVGPLTALAFSPDGLRCAAAGTGKVVVCDVDA